MYNIYINENTAIQVASERIEGALYKTGNRYTWLPKHSPVLPPNAEQVSPFEIQYVSHFTIWHNDISGEHKVLLKANCEYAEDSLTVWALDELHYAGYAKDIAGISFNRYADLYIPDTAVLRRLFPVVYDDGSRARLSLSEYIVDTDTYGEELANLNELVVNPYITFSSVDPNERIVGLSARLSKNHIVVDIEVPDAEAFLKKYNSGYVCYKISGYRQDGTVNTSTTITGVAERTLVSSDRYLISLNEYLRNKQMSFNIMPKFVDISITDVVVEVSAVFWKDSHTSLEDMHTGVVDCEAIYITRDPVSLSDKVPLSNGFYDVTWDDSLVLYAGSAAPFMEIQQYAHVPGPSRLKVYNCIKESDPVAKGGSSYTLFKVQVNKEQAVSTPTSIIVPFNEVICTVGVAALENIDNQSNNSSSDLWTSQK